MEDMNDNIRSIEGKINKLNDFITLSLRRNKISNELEQLTAGVIEVRDLMTEAHELMQKNLDNIEYDYEKVMSEMRKKQILVMQYTIKEKERKLKEAKDEENKVNILLSSSKPKNNSAIKAPNLAVKLLGQNLSKLNLAHSLTVTPKMRISEYRESPLVKKKIFPIPFQFEEFDVHITQQQFDKIPKYMCGRETLDQLNLFLQTIIIPCFNEKYQLLHKDRSFVRNPKDLDLWKLYNEQATSLQGRTFITPGDITRKLNKMLDKKSQNRLIMLKHVGILSEHREQQTVYYIWSYSGV